ncbi:MAG: aminomethyl transferase family protein [Nitrospirales bacterium]|nr:MAG: aminomethyl transferase family protein [Nitrospirales bacterium]
MSTLPLHEQHQALGVTFEKDGDWEVPSHYGNPQLEYEALHTGAGLADISSRGRVIVTGDDRITWLQSIISQDILPLQPGQGRYSTFMDHKGKMLSYFRVLIRPNEVVIEDVGEVGEQTHSALRKFLLYGTKAKMAKGIESQGLLLLSGPKAAGILKTAFGIEVENMASLQSIPFSFEEADGFLTRTEETGMADFELFVSLEALSSVWAHLLRVGEAEGLRPMGHATLETARIEAGLPRLGPDINDRIVPPEANLEGIAFSLSKGCYPGQEVVARMDTYGSVKRRLVGLVVEGTAMDLPEAGAKLFSGAREVGWVSSSTFSPLLQKPIALGFPLRDFTPSGTQLEVETQGKKYPASVTALPFTVPK